MILAFAMILATPTAPAAAPPKAPVPSSPYLPVIYRYADAMLRHGRDTHGPLATGMFLSALDRSTMAPLTVRPPAPEGVREGDRAGETEGPIVGANPHHDQNLLRLLEVLSGLSGNAAYRQAADNAMRGFLEHGASKDTGLLCWGEHMAWDTQNDRPVPQDPRAVHEFFRPWMLWDRCFDLAPDASARFARALWDHQVANHRTGAFDRHAEYWRHTAWEEHDFPRHAGFFIRTWAVAHARTKDSAMLEAIETVLRRFEDKEKAGAGWIESHAGSSNSWTASTLSLAIDCDGAAHHAPPSMAGRLRGFADRADTAFCALPHAVKNGGKGFVTVVSMKSRKPDGEVTPLWSARYGGYTTAQIGMMCVSRLDNTGKPAYRDLTIAAAAAYLDAMPPEDAEVWPGTLGQAISLQVAAWRHTARKEHLDKARTLADWAVTAFWGDQALPRAATKSDHYESITGADTLALALVELHLQILGITAVRCPPNTLDR